MFDLNSLDTSFYLFKSVKDFLSLTEVLEEQLQGPRNQGRVVVHDEVD